ncbi:uncharacterized protein [Amphiura filiformis]|uniref:uncharacterized protein n=1 Tax=Amphiura filiformis TaxID=82378 RepID=UPI003B20BB57
MVFAHKDLISDVGSYFADKGRCRDSGDTYVKLKKDPTKTYQNKLIKILKDFKSEGNLSDYKYSKLYPSSCCVPSFYGLPKVHKEGAPLRPIVSSINSVTYESAKYLADILNVLIGKSEHHIKNTESFVERIKSLCLEPGEIQISYDVSALFTSIPVDSALDVAKDLLEKDTSWKEKTELTADQVIQLLEFCLSTTYFVFRGQFYQQCGGCAMGSPVSPVIANLYMEHFEFTALRNSPVKPSVWLRYVDDTYVIIRETDVEIFTEHINSQNSHIKFTSESEVNGYLAFLDTKVSRNADGTVSISIYRKPTHTDQYLHFDSHHPIAHKLSVIRTLFHRAEIAVTDPEERVKEVDHIKSALGHCGYHNWTFGLAKAKDK